jgi:hypothetical protein
MVLFLFELCIFDLEGWGLFRARFARVRRDLRERRFHHRDTESTEIDFFQKFGRYRFFKTPQRLRRVKNFKSFLPQTLQTKADNNEMNIFPFPNKTPKKEKTLWLREKFPADPRGGDVFYSIPVVLGSGKISIVRKRLPRGAK